MLTQCVYSLQRLCWFRWWEPVSLRSLQLWSLVAIVGSSLKHCRPVSWLVGNHWTFAEINCYYGFFLCGCSLHTSSETKHSSAASPVEEASENSRSNSLLSTESMRALSGLSTDNRFLLGERGGLICAVLASLIYKGKRCSILGHPWSQISLIKRQECGETLRSLHLHDLWLSCTTNELCIHTLIHASVPPLSETRGRL